MNQVYHVDPALIPEGEYSEWETMLDRITPNEMPWVAYAIACNLNLFVAEWQGTLNVHVSSGSFNFQGMKTLDSLQLLKGLALKKLVMSLPE